MTKYCKKRGSSLSSFLRAKDRFNVKYENPLLSKKIFKTKKDVEEFIKEWKESGLTIEKFWKRKKITATAFYKAIKEFNVKYENNTSFFKTKKDVEEFIKEWKKNGNGKGIIDFIKDRGMSTTPFYNALEKFNIKYENKTTKKLLFNSKKEVQDFIKEWKKSGKGIHDFCKQKGMTPTGFYNYKRKYNL